MKNVHILPIDKPSRLFTINGKLYNYHKPQQGDGVNEINQNIYITDDSEIKVGDWFLWQGYGGEWFKEKCEYMLYEGKKTKHLNCNYKTQFKIILTTDPDLIKDGVQSIDDTFLQWFVNNPSCEFVEVQSEKRNWKEINYIIVYKIIIPQEESKKEVTGVDDNRPKPNYCYAKEQDHGEIGCVFPACHCGLPIKEEPKQGTLEEAARQYAGLHTTKEIDAEERYYNSNCKYYDAFKAGAEWKAERMYSEEDLKLAWEDGRNGTSVVGSFPFTNTRFTHHSFTKWFNQFKKK
jgi:hypothetical protein